MVLGFHIAVEIVEAELRDAGFEVSERDDAFVKFTGVAGGFWLIAARRPYTELRLDRGACRVSLPGVQVRPDTQWSTDDQGVAFDVRGDFTSPPDASIVGALDNLWRYLL